MGREILITGAAGFAGGFHVTEALSGHTAEGDPYQLLILGRDQKKLQKVQLQDSKRITPVAIDLSRDRVAVEMLLKEHKPQSIIHLAAYPAPVDSVKGNGETVRNNNDATRNLLDAVSQCSPETLVVVTTSLAVYGDREGELHEDLPLPTVSELSNPYARSKRNDIDLIEEYRERGLRIVEARVFNHTGPGQEQGLYSGIIRDAVAAKQQRRPLQRTGTLAYARDLQDVRDWASASLHLAETDASGTYNISSGQPITILEFLTLVGEQLDIAVEPTENPKPLPSGTPMRNWGRNSRLRTTGWQPQIALPQMVTDSAAAFLART